MEIISYSKPKARKEHSCNYCAGKIKKGEVYNRQFLKHDGVYVWKSHLKCDYITNELNMFDNCDVEGLTEDDFQEEIKNEYDNLTEDIVLKVAPSFQEQLDHVLNHYLSQIKWETIT